MPSIVENLDGHIEPEERPADAARPKWKRKPASHPIRLYNLSRVEAFYQERIDEVALVPVFAAFMDPGKP